VRWIDEATGTITVTDLDAVLSLPTATSRATLEATANGRRAPAGGRAFGRWRRAASGG
jgi:hypothetical protein